MSSNLRILKNPDPRRAEKPEFPWIKLILGSAVTTGVLLIGLETVKYFMAKSKLASQPALLPPPIPVPQFQPATLSGYPSVQNPLTPQNPLMSPSDEPPKWFAQFKAEQDRRFAQLERTPNPKKSKKKLSVVEDEEEYEEEEVG